MKKLLFTLTILGLLSFNSSQRIIQLYEDDIFRCSNETEQGRIDGKYTSYYSSGQIKAEGRFENNYRTGKWTVWDTTGRIRMEREYSDPFNFERLIPKIPKEKTIQLLNKPRYTIQYNEEGFIEPFDLKERMVIYSKRIWRMAKPEINPLLFDNNRLFHLLTKNILAKNISAYDPKDVYLSKEISLNMDTSEFTIIGFKIQEDFYFDIDRFVSQTSIITLCPVATHKRTKDTLELYQVYLPEVRKYLVQEKIQAEELPSKIKTLDDLFFYRYFSAQIYKESNQFDREISDYTSVQDIAKEAERIEISLIEDEHDIWLRFTK